MSSIVAREGKRGTVYSVCYRENGKLVWKRAGTTIDEANACKEMVDARIKLSQKWGFLKDENIKIWREQIYRFLEHSLLYRTECEVCGYGKYTEMHHFLPRTTKNNDWGGDNDERNFPVFLCPTHHREVHQLINSREFMWGDDHKFNSEELKTFYVAKLRPVHGLMWQIRIWNTSGVSFSDEEVRQRNNLIKTTYLNNLEEMLFKGVK